MGEILSANDGNFEDFIKEGKTVIADFWAPTCAPCRLLEPGLEKIAFSNLEPGLEKIAFSNPDNVKVIRINVNESPKTSARFFIRTLPTLLFFKDGQVKTQIIGAVNPKQIEKTLNEIG